MNRYIENTQKVIRLEKFCLRTKFTKKNYFFYKTITKFHLRLVDFEDSE